MHSILVVTTPASSLQLLTIEEMREAAGVTGSGSDTALTAMGLRLAAAVTTECNVAIGAGAEPTLLRETLTQTFRQVCAPVIVLSRRHNIQIASIVEGNVTLDAAEYEVDPESGILTRLCKEIPVIWSASKIVVVYDAGFETVPGDLKMAALDFFRLAWREKDRDPSLKSEVVDIPDVRRVERGFWVGVVPGMSSSEGAVPEVVSGQLARFRNACIA